MPRDSDRVLDTASSIADGTDVNWDEAEAAAASEEDRRLLRQLRLLAGIADVHRSAPASPEIEPDEPLDEATRRVAPRAPETVLGRWGHLELVEKVGEGTFGEVYRARDTHLDRYVAVKLLRPDASRSRMVERVLHEGRTLARIRHHNVVTVYGVEEHDGRVGVWMELVQGSTLAALLARQGPYSAREAALIGQDICRALAAVHGAGLVHRDIKAQNVMREHGGRVVLMDFGAGRPRDADRLAPPVRMTGTPMYLAPELLGGDADATVPSDIYGLGVLLYHLVTRAYPVQAASLDALREAHTGARRTPLNDARPDLPDGFVAVVERALHPEPARRYQSAGAMQSALAASLGLDTATELPAAASAVRWRRSAPRVEARPRPDAGTNGPERARRLRWLAGLAVAGLALAAALALVWQRSGTPVGDPGYVPLLVIRPFEPMTPADRVLASGLTSEVSRQLGMLQAPLSVAPLGVAERLPPDTAEEEVLARLEADALLTGRVGQQDAEIVVSLRMVRAGAGGPAWEPAAFTRAVRESFELTEHMAEQIAAELAVPRRSERRRSRPVNPDAWDAYLLARYELSQPDPERADRAIRLLQKARGLQPGFAEADAALGHAYLWSTFTLATPAQHAVLISNAREAARQALRLNPDLAEAHFVLADISFVEEWNWAAAAEQFADALRLGPAEEVIRYRYAMFLAARQRLDEALAVIRDGRRLNPLSPRIASYEGQTLHYAGRHDQAIEAFHRALSLDSSHTPANQGLCRAYLALGRAAEALPECEMVLQAHEASHDEPAALRTDRYWHWLRVDVAQAYVGVGRDDEARAILADLRRGRAARPDAVMPEAIALVLVALGEHDEAFEWLDVALREKSRPIRFLGVDPRFNSLRADPRFETFADALGLE